MSECLLGLGSNQDDRASLVARAVELLCDGMTVSRVALSDLIETRPVGGPADQAPYLNAVLRVTTRLSPAQLWNRARYVEQQLGRRRLERWGPRRIDVDLLMFDDLIVDTPDLILPHPRMAVRRFVLQGACQIAAEMVHATTDCTIATLLARLDHPPYYIALAGTDRALRESVAQRGAAARGDACLLTEPPIEPRSAAPLGPPLARDLPPPVQHELAVLGRQLDTLHAPAHRGLWDSDQWIISSFWTGQALAAVRALAEADARAGAEQACVDLLRDGPQPLLVILLDAASDAPPTAMQEVSDQLRQLAVTRGFGPVIRVPDGDPEWAAQELAGAMDAVR